MILPIITFIEFIILINEKERERKKRERRERNEKLLRCVNMLRIKKIYVKTYRTSMCAYVHEFHGEAGMITAKPGFSKSIRERKKEREIEEKKHVRK